MTDDDQLDEDLAQIEDLGFAPEVVGTADASCGRCRVTLLGVPVLRCGCGCAAPMTRICSTCGGAMLMTRRQ